MHASPTSLPSALPRRRHFYLTLTLLLLSAAVARADSATWSATPATSFWNNSANWVPATIPNGPNNVATFAASSITQVTLPYGFDDPSVRGLVFTTDASAFGIFVDDIDMAIDGFGIKNESATTQHLSVANGGDGGSISFQNHASAGHRVVMTAEISAAISFADTSTGETATFENLGGASFDDKFFYGGATYFAGSSNASHATCNNHPGLVGPGGRGGSTVVEESASAGFAVFNNQGADAIGNFGGSTGLSGMATAFAASFNNFAGTVAGGYGGTTNFNGASGTPSGGRGHFHQYGAAFAGTVGEGTVYFLYGAPSAGDGYFINDGGRADGAPGGLVSFADSANALNAVFVNHGGTVAGAGGGLVIFSGNSDAGSATLVNLDRAAEGAAGGTTRFLASSTGGTCRVLLNGAGTLDLSSHYAPGVSIGSIAGNGLVELGGNALTVGSDNCDTTFAGSMEDSGLGGSLVKIGTGTLTLTRPSTYSGGTTISGGTLLLQSRNSSATGTGPVQVNDGSFGGSGTIAGALTIGNGSGDAALAPGGDGAIGRLRTLQGISFAAGSTCRCEIDSNSVAVDAVIANGITIDPSATLALADLGGSALPAGTVFTLLQNTSSNAILGAFANLPDGSLVTIGSNRFRVNYSGGDGNDLTLTVEA